MMSEVNSKDWWENYFKNYWEMYGGIEQTEFFCRLALDHLPKWLLQDIKDNQFSICDAGCAEGQGTKLLTDLFQNAYVIGIDYSEEAITKARHFNPDVNFSSEDILSLNSKYDVIYTSNTLEHFKDPFRVAEVLARNTNRYLILLLPFQEYERHESHEVTFDFDSFPIMIERLKLIEFKIIDCTQYENRYWNGKQILAIYCDQDSANITERYYEINKNLTLELDSIKKRNIWKFFGRKI